MPDAASSRAPLSLEFAGRLAAARYSVLEIGIILGGVKRACTAACAKICCAKPNQVVSPDAVRLNVPVG
jgi:hypothetical protein